MNFKSITSKRTVASTTPITPQPSPIYFLPAYFVEEFPRCLLLPGGRGYYCY